MNAPEFLKQALDKKFVSFLFTDIAGKLHRMTYCTNNITEDLLENGIGFDGSSIKGWKDIHQSDMLLLPDLTSVFNEPFTSQECINVICNIRDPQTQKGYLRDPRNIALQAEKFLRDSKIAEIAYIGPEVECFIFDDVKYNNSPQSSFYRISSEEMPNNKLFRNSHYLNYKEGYFPAQPQDTLFDVRAEICTAIADMGLQPSLHHHEVGISQCEIGFKFDTLVRTGDNVQKFKYAVKNTAASFGKTATFMPKPVFNDNGSGMHVHISLWKDGHTLFYQADQYANLSPLCKYFIGGIIKHAKVLNAFTNPTVNSYKRLVPGFEAPVNLAYSANNRSAAIRIPHVTNNDAKRIEVRFPDPSCNPYLAFAAMIMAGLDGILNKIEPGEPIDENLYHSKDKVKNVCADLSQALDELNNNREFLKKGEVFTDDFIDTYIQLKRKEIDQIRLTPTPLEFKLYYSC